MKIAVFGSGGVGGYFGGKLAASGEDVTFLARGAHLAAMQRDGLRISSPLGDVHVPHVQATDRPQAIGPVDVVLFTVKLYDVDAAASSSRCRTAWMRWTWWRNMSARITSPAAPPTSSR
jgi:2-dehydropantoate 2-reductase